MQKSYSCWLHERKIQKCLEKSDRLIQLARTNPRLLLSEAGSEKDRAFSDGSSPTVFDRLKQFVLKHRSDNSSGFLADKVYSESHLLEAFIKQEKLNYLVLCLYPNDEGFTFGLRKSNVAGGDDQIVESVKLPYEDELLECVQNGWLPPFLVDMIDSNDEEDEHLDLFYCGSIFVQIRDYRRNNGNCEIRFTCLKPNDSTLINDINKLTSTWSINQKPWTQSDKLALEAALVLETSEPLCLDPDPTVSVVVNRLQYQNQWLKSSQKLKRLAKKHSQAHQNRVKKLQSMDSPRHLKLHDFLKEKVSETLSTAKMRKNPNTWKEKRGPLGPAPKNLEIDKVAKALRLPPLKSDNGLIKVEEFYIEFVDPEKSNTFVITMFHRPVDDTYFGQLCVNRSRDVHQANSSSCLFQFGNKQLTKKYIDQFTDILTENGKKAVKIVRQVAGCPPKVTYSGNMVPPVKKDPEKPTVAKTLNVSPQKAANVAPLGHQNIHPTVVSLAKALSTNPQTLASAADIHALATSGVLNTHALQRSNTTPITTVTKVPSLSASSAANSKPETALAVILTTHPLSNQKSGAGSTVPPTTKTENPQEATVSSAPIHCALGTVSGATITTTSAVPSTINLGSLNLGTVQNLRLHNLLSLTNVHGVSQGIALPISLAMMSSTSGSTTASVQNPQGTTFMTSPTSMIVGIDTTMLQSQLAHKPNDQ